ncbi:RnfH family protein [Glaciimonas immobilis]|nr:RnfH family protein [Glaciimonas immobilis]
MSAQNNADSKDGTANTLPDTTAVIHVQVCYGTPTSQPIRSLTVPQGTLLHDAIIRSGILDEWHEIDLNHCRVGIFGKLKALDTLVRDRDRIEIYRGLIADPKESRRKRASKVAGEDGSAATDKKSR